MPPPSPSPTSKPPRPRPAPAPPCPKPLREGPAQRNRSGPRTRNGSYLRYYTRRNTGIHGDDRLPLLRAVLARAAATAPITILDIGCNDGTVTTDLASLPGCRRAIGIDINTRLIGYARKRLRRFVHDHRRPVVHTVQGALPQYRHTLPPDVRRAVMASGHAPRHDAQEPPWFSKFPQNVKFRCEDIAQPDHTVTSREHARFDVILCLSVTKWVHFAWGDDGLKRLFKRIHDCLKPGGVLILEPQPMKSYKSAIRKGLGKKDLTGERKLKPHDFSRHLLLNVGFVKMRMLRDVREKGQAFNRPIMAFGKRALVRWKELFVDSPPSVDLFQYVFAGDTVGVVPLGEVPQNAQPVGAAEPNANAEANEAPVNEAPQNEAPIDALGNQAPAVAAAMEAMEAQPGQELAQEVPAHEAPAIPVTANAAPTNVAPENSDEQVVNVVQSVDVESSTIDSNADHAANVPLEQPVEVIPEQPNPEPTASGSDESSQQETTEQARDANPNAESTDGAVSRISGSKRGRTEDDEEESDGPRSKIPRQDDNNESTQ